MTPWLRINLPYLVILGLVFLIIFNTCHRDGQTYHSSSDTTINNTIRQIDSVVIVKPVETKYVPYIPSSKDTIFIASKDIQTLTKQYQDIVKLFAAERQYRQEFNIDTIGRVLLVDTVRENQIIGRSFKYDLKIPEKTITITNTIYPKLRNKWFIGGGIGGNQYNVVNDVNLGVAVLSKKEHLYELKYRRDFQGNQFAELNTFWKIHF